VLDGEMEMDENIAVHGWKIPLKIQKNILGAGKGERGNCVLFFVSSFCVLKVNF
jgi:hypothetical protein